MRFTRNLLGRKNQRGVALMMAIFTVVIILYLATEILYDTNIEYVVNSQAVSKVKAYYAAKAGYEMSLLRIKIFSKITQQMGDQIPADKKKLLDMIWEFPFSWPPMIPAEASGVDKDMIGDKVKESKMDGTYVTSISDEGSKIDINDLGSPSKALRDVSKKLLMQIFENRKLNDEEWAKNHQDIRAEEIVNNIADWVDDDSLSQNGGDEAHLYDEIKVEDVKMPPNRAFRSVDELRLVPLVNDEIFAMLKDRVTVFGTHAINPNYASAEVLKAIDTSFSDEVVGKMIARRNDPKLGGPYKDDADFWAYANSQQGVRVPDDVQKQIPLVFGQAFNFRIRSTGEFKNVTREIEAVVFDLNSSVYPVASKMQQEAVEKAGQTYTPAKNNNKDTLPKGPPRVVYFMER